MKQGVLAIYDKDTGYACRLMEYLNQKADFLLEARVFTNLLSLQDYLEENVVELLLAGEEIGIGELPRKRISRIMLLTEHSMPCEGEEHPYLYKFQSMENMVRKMALCYENPTGRIAAAKMPGAEKSKKLIGVFSPFGGSGKTLFSLALGQALSDGANIHGEMGSMGKRQMPSGRHKVLYIGMEAFSSFEEEEDIRGNLSDILYWIRERKEGCLAEISLMAAKRGRVDCILSSDYYEDLNSMTEEDAEFFLNELYKDQSYETVIFDIGCWNKAMFFLLEQMDCIYMPDFLNRTFLKKENELLNSMRLTGKQEIYSKIKKILLPFDEMIYQGNYSLDKLEKTAMGQYVWKLIKKDLP